LRKSEDKGGKEKKTGSARREGEGPLFSIAVQEREERTTGGPRRQSASKEKAGRGKIENKDDEPPCRFDVPDIRRRLQKTGVKPTEKEGRGEKRRLRRTGKNPTKKKKVRRNHAKYSTEGHEQASESMGYFETRGQNRI